MSKELAPIYPMSDLVQMATAIAQSKLFGIQTAEQAIALCLLAQAEGLHPATAARDYHIIQGKPCLTADAMLAKFQAAGGSVNWTRYDDEAVTGEFTHPQGGTVAITWDTDRAKLVGLLGKDNWRKYPRQMRRARAISEGVRTVCPGVLQGMYTPEEITSDVVRDTEYVEVPAAKVKPAKPTTPQWFDVWPLDELAEYKVSNGDIAPAGKDVIVRYYLSYDGVSATAVYRNHAKAVELTGLDNPGEYRGRIRCIVKRVKDHPLLSEVAYLDTTLTCPAPEGVTAAKLEEHNA